MVDRIITECINEVIAHDLTLYHGTPYNFVSFQTTNIGSGEGNQSFGYGLYLTSNKDVANYYAKILAKDKSYVYTVKITNGNFFEWYEKLDDNFQKEFINQMRQNGYDEMPYKRMLSKGMVKNLYMPIEQAVKYFPNGKFFYENLSLMLGGDKNASFFLKKLGFTGIKYPIGSFFHGKNKGEYGYNYVIFSGDDIQIVNKEVLTDRD